MTITRKWTLGVGSSGRFFPIIRTILRYWPHSSQFQTGTNFNKRQTTKASVCGPTHQALVLEQKKTFCLPFLEGLQNTLEPCVEHTTYPPTKTSEDLLSAV